MTGNKGAKYKVGLIGAGRAGVPRARAFDLHPSCKVTAIADTDPENLELATRRFGVPGYAGFEEMLANEELDIGMAVLPVRPNADAVVALARAGVKAIFCEKPLTASLEDADRMVEETASRGIPLVCGLVASSHPDYQKAYELAASGEIGDIVRINIYEGNSQMGTHGLNVARRFAGKSDADWVVGWVSGDPASETEDEHEDGAPGYGSLGGYVRFANGIDCFTSYGPQGWRADIEVLGTSGVIRNRNNTGLGFRLLKYKGNADWSDLDEVEGVFLARDQGDLGYDGEGWRDAEHIMLVIVDEIVEFLETGAEIGLSTGDDMRHALEIAIALRESARRDHAVVKLPIQDRGIVMLPVKSRWFYKKTLLGREAYMAELATQKND